MTDKWGDKYLKKGVQRYGCRLGNVMRNPFRYPLIFFLPKVYSSGRFLIFYKALYFLLQFELTVFVHPCSLISLVQILKYLHGPFHST